MNKALWDEVINGKVAVNCRTENQAKKFLRICDAKGLRWCDGVSLTFRNRWEIFRGETCYKHKKEGLVYNDICTFECESLKVITFKQLMKSDRPKEDKQEQFRGWQILKMIEDGKLKDELVIGKDGTPRAKDRIEDARVSFLMMNEPFTIKPKEKHYLTFDEARRTGKKFKYRTWEEYRTLICVMFFLSNEYRAKEINQMLDERAWMVEE